MNLDPEENPSPQESVFWLEGETGSIVAGGDVIGSSTHYFRAEKVIFLSSDDAIRPLVGASSEMISALRGLSGDAPTWSEVRDPLLELYAILDEWCEAAEALERLIRGVLEAHQPDEKFPYYPPFARIPPIRSGRTNLVPGYIDRMQSEISGLLKERVHWAKRWSLSRRRKAARRGLRNVMRIYCPDVLESFEAAVEGRSAWMEENRAELILLVENPDASAEEISQASFGLSQTYYAMYVARGRLGEMIREAFPLGPTPGSA
ncbi:hypothetical protein [Streptomyces sp. NPDC020951]|uniref:hypothetical protein n=1 Tax=Streptomyces sp. NPDC020951 TaxID=3365104 RepID=UPI0037981AAA